MTDPETALLADAVVEPDDACRIELASLIHAGADPLGEAFISLRNPVERRALGATYTPASIVNPMVRWLADYSDCARVIDPGAGSGRFLLAAAKQLPNAELVAVEIDPVAALMLRACLTAAELDDRSRVIVGDYRNAPIGDRSGRTAFIGNPPYVRHHNINARWKNWYASTARKHGLPGSKLAGMHLHFFLATLAHSAPGDFGVFVTASEWLDVNYGRTLRQMLTDKLGVVSITRVNPKARPFPDSTATAAITCFHISSKPSRVRFRRVSRNSELDLHNTSSLDPLDKGRYISRQQLLAAQRWTPLFNASCRSMPEGYIELGEVCRVHRGTATGRNATWLTNMPGSQTPEPDLPSSVLFPAVTRAKELFDSDGTITSTRGFRAIINLPLDFSEFGRTERQQIERFLYTAQQMGVHKGYIARHRKAWWSVGLREPAPILATYMARRAPAFVRNIAGLYNTNVVHGIYPKEPMSTDLLDMLAEALRRSATVDQGRTYAGGLTKFEPKEMESLAVPSLKLLTELASQ